MRHKTLIALAILPSALIMVSNLIFPYIVKKTLNLGVDVYGISDMFAGVGAFFSGFFVIYFLSRQKNNKKITTMFLFGFFSFLFLFFGIFFDVKFIVFVIYGVKFVFGLVIASLRGLFNAVYFDEFEYGMLARVLSVTTMMSLSLHAILSLLLTYILEITQKADYALIIFSTIFFIAYITSKNLSKKCSNTIHQA